MDQNGAFHVVRIAAFRCYEPQSEPSAVSMPIYSYNRTLAKSFKALKWHPVPITISPTTLHFMSLEQALNTPTLLNGPSRMILNSTSSITLVPFTG